MADTDTQNKPDGTLGDSDAAFNDIVQNNYGGGTSGATGGTPSVHGAPLRSGRGRHSLSGSKARRRNPMRPQHYGSGGGIAGGPSSLDDDGSDRLLNDTDIPSPEKDDEPKDLAPVQIDPTKDDAEDSFDTAGRAYNEQFNPTQQPGMGLATSEPNEQQVANLENSSGDSTSNYAPAKSPAETERFGDQNDTLGRGFNNSQAGGLASAAANATPVGRLTGILRGLGKGKGRRNAGIGGLLVTGILIFVGLANFAGAFALQDLRQNLLGIGNSEVNFSNNVTRRNSTHRILQKIKNGENFKKNISNDLMVEKLRAQGFIIELGDVAADGTRPATKFGFKSQQLGKELFLDLDKDIYASANKSFLKGRFGNEMGRAYEKATSSKVTLHKGIAGRNLFSKMKLKLSNWAKVLREKVGDRQLTQSEKIADALRHSDPDTVDNPTLTSGRALTDAERDFDGDGVPDQEVFDETMKLDDVSNAAETRKKLLDEPFEGAEDAAKINLASDIADVSERSVKSGFREGLEELFKNMDEIAKQVGGAQGARISARIGTSALKAINLVDWHNRACRISGTLKFITNVQATAFAFELGRFAVKLLVAADHQQAGLIQSDGVRLVMQYLSYRATKTGATYAQSGGLRWRKGDHTAVVDKSNLGMLSGSRNPAGWLGTIKESIGQVVTPGACRVTNNGFIQVGGFVAGVAVAFFSVGSVTAGQVATSVGLAVLEEAVFLVGEPLLLKVGTRMALNGLERNGLYVGDALASGIGAYFAMNAGTNGMRLMTKPKAAMLRQQVAANNRDALAEMSVFERYLSPSNTQSMTAKMLSSMPTSLGMLASDMSQKFMSVVGSGSAMPFGGLIFNGMGKAYAQENAQCNDDQVLKYNVETDPFCHPIVAAAPDLDLKETEDMLLAAGFITADGTPVDKDIVVNNVTYNFSDYIKNCHNGRPGTLYKAEIAKDGTEDETNADCIEVGEPLASETRTERDAYAYLTEDIEEPTSLFAFFRPKKAVAQAELGSGLVGVRERFAAHLAGTINEENFAEDISNSFEPVGNGTQQQNPTNPGGGNANLGELYQDSSSIACAAGTDGGVQIGYVDGAPVNVRVCNLGQNIRVNTRIVSQIDRMLKDATAAGIDLTYVADSFRTIEDQEFLWIKFGQDEKRVARPGYSNHQMGLALDMSCSGGSFGGTACFDWMVANGANYGMSNYQPEPWHWSVTGN